MNLKKQYNTMKPFTLISRWYLFLLLLFTPLEIYGQQALVQKWEKVGPITFTAAAYPSPGHVVMTTSHGYIYSSTDDGKSWERQEIGDSLDLTGISFADPLHGMIISNSWSKYLVTSDGGISWQLHTSPMESPFCIANTSPDTAYIVNWIGNIYRTIDRGANWVKQYNVPGSDTATSTSAFPLKMYFRDSKRGFVLGMDGMYVHTTDAGEHWVPSDFALDTPLSDIDFYNNDTGVISGWGAYYLTTDAGNTWVGHVMPQAIYNNLTAIRFTSSKNFFAFSQYNQSLYLSTDFGASLRPIDLRQSDNVNCVVRTATGWIAAGAFGTICKGALPEGDNAPSWTSIAECPVNGGSAFHATNGNILQSFSSGPYPLISKDSGILWNVADLRYQSYAGMHFPSPDTGYLFNYSDLTIGMTTNDSGQSWKPVEMQNPLNGGGITGPSFGSQKVGYAIAQPYVLITTDAGLDWKLDSIPQPNVCPYSDCKVWGGAVVRAFALNAEHAFVSMRIVDTLIVQSGKHYWDGTKIHYPLYETTDGGATWSQFQNLPAIHLLTDIYFRNTLVGFVTCDSGRIYRTSDGGNTWTKEQLASFNHTFSTLNFLNDQIGFASLDSQAVLETTDGGESWNWLLIPTNREEVSMSTGQIEFPDSNTVLVSGVRVMFQNINPPLLIQDFGFYRGKIGLGSASVAKQESQPSKQELSLSLYPNPARNAITVRVLEAGPQIVSIAVLDILGRTVKQLRAQTNSDFSFDVHSLSNGVYTLRCTSESQIGTTTFTVLR
jgi:photosystem II stability/assembly factor-like uncharacterized protein